MRHFKHENPSRLTKYPPLQIPIIPLQIIFTFTPQTNIYTNIIPNYYTTNKFAEPTETPIQEEIPTPCTPSPCGANAICREQNNIGACQCLPDYYGNPYDGCRPECVTNSECPNHLACLNNKCKDPCPGVCGQNAECRVVNHSPQCYCQIGFNGNPLAGCHKEERLPPSKQSYTILHSNSTRYCFSFFRQFFDFYFISEFQFISCVDSILSSSRFVCNNAKISFRNLINFPSSSYTTSIQSIQKRDLQNTIHPNHATRIHAVFIVNAVS